MGTVYHALQKSLDKPVAIKVLSGVSDRDGPVVQRFLREAFAAAKLRHPNIVDVHGIGRTPDGGYFLVMDLVRGTDLENCAKSGEIEIHQALSLVATIADAVQHAHDHGVIHRDLKPSTRAGIMAGESARDGRLRCQLYSDYLKNHLTS